MRQPTKFRSTFKDAQEVCDLIGRRETEKKAKPTSDRVQREEAYEAGQNLLLGLNVRASLRCIYRWKLGSFVRRFKWVKIFPDNVSDQMLDNAVSLARKAIENSNDKDSVREALEALTAIRGVRVPVASAFLMAMDPKRFTIIDRQAYKALGVEFRDGILDYLEYLWFCRREAERLRVTLEEHDRALWQRGVELGRLKRGQNLN
ncbi:MAG: hypothetical protein IT539_11255 [Bradyrhizobiaceae bacterium]|nr:hypothetical protein [Bradyrhizobiaceae bacterium]